MTFTETIFAKRIEEVTFDDVKKYFITDKTETNYVEYKSYNASGSLDSNCEIIRKAISAFLNSDGGLVIWGAPRGVKVTGHVEDVFKGDLFPLNVAIGKDALVNKLSDKIVPLPNSIRLEILPNAENSQWVVLIEIIKSEYAPHQTSNTYYMRMDGQSRPTPHHYIEALMKQIKFPQIEGRVKFVSMNLSGEVVIVNIEVMLFNFSQLQNETDLAFFLVTNPGTTGAGYGPQRKIILDDVLSFGQPTSTPLSIVISEKELYRTSGVWELNLSFSGRTSPAKISAYKFQVKTEASDINDCLVEAKENKLYSDIQNAFPMTKLERLSKILGREVKD